MALLLLTNFLDSDDRFEDDIKISPRSPNGGKVPNGDIV